MSAQGKGMLAADETTGTPAKHGADALSATTTLNCMLAKPKARLHKRILAHGASGSHSERSDCDPTTIRNAFASC